MKHKDWCIGGEKGPCNCMDLNHDILKLNSGNTGYNTISIAGLEEIKKLKTRNSYNRNGDCNGVDFPGSFDTMVKINDIIDKLNILIKMHNEEVNSK